MQPRCVTTCSVNPIDWTLWLDSIVLHPQQHKQLTQVGANIHYLDEQESGRMQRIGQSVHKLTLNEIITITQKIWKDPGVNCTQKKQMLDGISYIHQQRQLKYNRLFWLLKIFAKLRGTEAQLRAEAQEIDLLAKHWEALSALPVLGNKAIWSEKKKEALDLIQQQMKELTETKDKWKDEDKEIWYESFFNLEKQLYDLRQTLSKDQLMSFASQLKELDKNLHKWNEKIPRLKSIVKVFGNKVIKSSLHDTLTSLCANKNITQEDLDRDQALFQCNRLEVEALYVKRLIRAERTHLSLALVTAIERTWKEIGESKQEAETKLLEGKRVIFIPKDREIYLKEYFIAKGSYKAAFLITPFHTLKKIEDRCRLVILQPIDAVLKEIEEAEEKPQLSDSKSSATSESKHKTSISSSDANETEDEMGTEAENCLLYGKLPGVWPTYKVATVDGHVSIIQLSAGYDLETHSKKIVSAISLEDMITLLEENELPQKEQLVFLKMIRDFLTGLESFRESDLLHRDLKGENILCSKEGKAAISDLGTLCANKINKAHDLDQITEKEHNPAKKNLIGTPYYIAPEVVCYHDDPINWTKIGTAADIWATGLILWQALSGQPLLKHPAYQAIRQFHRPPSPLMVIQKIGKILLPTKCIYNGFYVEPKMKTSLAHLVWSCTRADPEQRPTIGEVIKRYEAWEKYTAAKMRAGEIQSVCETFEDDVVFG
jgi:serine/threonine protein kinase